jgi:hypothetical protein
MPVHDWTRVGAGTFHDFHSGWIIELRNALNAGLLPAPYYAMADQVAGSVGPDVLTLQGNGSAGGPQPTVGQGPTAVALAPPKVRFTATAERDLYAKKQRSLVIRHGSEDRIVALIEILSPGNKGSRHAMHTFVEKAVGVLSGGYHLLLIDLLPPGPRDPQGIHGAVWAELGDDAYTQPPDKPLTLASYVARDTTTAYYVEPVAVGDVLIDMPLFLTPELYASVPLEATYLAAWRGLGWRWRAVLEAPAQS